MMLPDKDYMEMVEEQIKRIEKGLERCRQSIHMAKVKAQNVSLEEALQRQSKKYYDIMLRLVKIRNWEDFK